MGWNIEDEDYGKDEQQQNTGEDDLLDGFGFEIRKVQDPNEEPEYNENAAVHDSVDFIEAQTIDPEYAKHAGIMEEGIKKPTFDDPLVHFRGPSKISVIPSDPKTIVHTSKSQEPTIHSKIAPKSKKEKPSPLPPKKKKSAKQIAKEAEAREKRRALIAENNAKLAKVLPYGLNSAHVAMSVLIRMTDLMETGKRRRWVNALKTACAEHESKAHIEWCTEAEVVKGVRICRRMLDSGLDNGKDIPAMKMHFHFMGVHILRFGTRRWEKNPKLPMTEPFYISYCSPKDTTLQPYKNAIESMAAPGILTSRISYKTHSRNSRG